MMGEGPIKIVDLEKDRFAFDFERPEIVFFVRVIGVTEVVERGDRLDNPVDGVLAEGGYAQSDDGTAANQMLTQIIVEGTNPLGLLGHGISPCMKRWAAPRAAAEQPEL
jgi:hypothetical protein